MARTKSQQVSEYELQRQEKIAKNKALLRELQLNAASAGLAPSSKRQTSSTSSKPKKKTAPRVKQEDLAPRRTSSRLKGIVADSEVAKRKAEEERDAFQEAERAKRQRVSDDLGWRDMVVSGDNWNKSGNWLRNVRPANPYERTFDEEAAKTTSNKELKELREKYTGLELWKEIEPAKIKVTPERIYCLGFHPTPDKQLVFAGDKMGNLGLFDGSQAVPGVKAEDDDTDELAEDETLEITTFKPHTRTISALYLDPLQPQSVFTSSYDSSLRKFDLEKGVSTEIYAPSSKDIDEPLSGMSIPITDPHMVYFTSLNGLFGMHDTRTPATSSPVELLQLSEKKIGGFSVHPLHPHLLATASLDRTLKLWDLRKLTGKGPTRRAALLAEHESKLSVSHAAFNSAGQIATSSYDDTIKIHSLSNSGSISPGHSLTPEAFAPSAIIPHNNQTGRWVTILRPYWQAQPSEHLGGGAQRFVIGNMNRFVDVYAGTGEQIAQLGGDGITAVPAVVAIHPSCDWVAGGTASGKLALWV